MTLDPIPGEPKGRTARAGVGFLSLCLTAILTLTLTPIPEWQESSKYFGLCLLCNPGAVPDAIKNTLLFLPLGIALAFRSHRALPSVLFGALLSSAIEILQFVIPGRYPNLQDICTNTLGTFLGFHIARSYLGLPLAQTLAWNRKTWEQWKRPDPVLANRLMLASTLLAITVFALTGWLLAPAFPQGHYLFAAKEMDTGATPLRVGANGDETGYFKGTIDEVRIYNRVLPLAEIQADSERAVSATSLHSPQGLVAAYGFDEESGDQVLDSSGQGNDGLLHGAVRTAGRFGKALEFDGHSDEVIIPHTPILDLTTGMTLETWVRPEVPLSSWPAVIQKGGDHYFLYAGADMTLTPNGGGTFGAASEGVAAPQALSTGVWIHLAVSYDGSILRIYVNGRQVASSVRWFQGRIDRISVGNTAVHPGFVDTQWLRHALKTGEVIRLHGISGKAMSDNGALLDIKNRYPGDHILLVTVHGNDLAVRYFTVAAALGLPSPEIRLGGALRGVTPGSPLDVELLWPFSAQVLTINGVAHRGLGFSLGMGWTVIVYSEYMPVWLRELLNMAWMAAWIFPVGYWSQTRRVFLGASLILGMSLLILPTLGTLLPTPITQWAAAALGLLAGVVVRKRVAHSPRTVSAAQ
jgi:hypothetical protein